MPEAFPLDEINAEFDWWSGRHWKHMTVPTTTFSHFLWNKRSLVLSNNNQLQ